MLSEADVNSRTEGKFGRDCFAQFDVVALSDCILGGDAEEIVASLPELRGRRLGRFCGRPRHANPVVARRVSPLDDVGVDRRAAVTGRLVPGQRDRLPTGLRHAQVSGS